MSPLELVLASGTSALKQVHLLCLLGSQLGLFHTHLYTSNVVCLVKLQSCAPVHKLPFGVVPGSVTCAAVTIYPPATSSMHSIVWKLLGAGF